MGLFFLCVFKVVFFKKEVHRDQKLLKSVVRLSLNRYHSAEPIFCLFVCLAV